ncbi:MAG: PEP-CTERM sorting domain-containing protein [Phycisphaerae bacterium]
MLRKPLLLAACATLSFGAFAGAATIASFDFEDQTKANSLAPLPTGISAVSDMSWGGTGTPPKTDVIAFNQGSWIYRLVFPGDTASIVRVWTYTVDVEPGYEVDLTGWAASASAQGVGSDLVYTVNGIDVGSFVVDTNSHNFAIPPSGSGAIADPLLNGLTGTITVELSMGGQERFQANLDNVVLSGDVGLIPEPTSLAGLSLLAGVLVRRRR